MPLEKHFACLTYSTGVFFTFDRSLRFLQCDSATVRKNKMAPTTFLLSDPFCEYFRRQPQRVEASNASPWPAAVFSEAVSPRRVQVQGHAAPVRATLGIAASRAFACCGPRGTCQDRGLHSRIVLSLMFLVKLGLSQCFSSFKCRILLQLFVLPCIYLAVC